MVIAVLVGLLVLSLAVVLVLAARRRDRAVRTAESVPCRSERWVRGEPGAAPGGPFLHWVPDRRGGWRLAGDYLPRRTEPAPPPRTRRRMRSLSPTGARGTPRRGRRQAR